MTRALTEDLLSWSWGQVLTRYRCKQLLREQYEEWVDLFRHSKGHYPKPDDWTTHIPGRKPKRAR